MAGVESTVCKSCNGSAEGNDGFRTVQHSKKTLSYKDATLKSTDCCHVPLSNRFEALTGKSVSAGKRTIGPGAADCALRKDVLTDHFPLLPA